MHGPFLVPRGFRVEAGEGVLVEDDLSLDDPVVEAEVGDGQLDQILLVRVLAPSLLSRSRRRWRGGRCCIRSTLYNTVESLKLHVLK